MATVRRIRPAVLALAAVIGASAGAQPVPSATAATAVAPQWLEGTWVSEVEGTRIEERWTSPAGGAMLGTNRTLRGGRMTGFEFLRIITREGRLVYVAQPGGRPPTEFPLAESGPDLLVFENQGHDFPKRLRYRRTGSILVVELDGIEGGQPARATFTFALDAGSRR